jgi:hypothetical protein
MHIVFKFSCDCGSMRQERSWIRLKQQMRCVSYSFSILQLTSSCLFSGMLHQEACEVECNFSVLFSSIINMGILCLMRLEVTAELWYKLRAALWMVVEGRSEQSEPRHSCCCSSCSLFLQHLCRDYSREVIFVLLDLLRHPLHLIIAFWILLGWVVGILCVGYMNFKLKWVIMRSFCHQATNDACNFEVLTKCQSI